MNNVRPLLFSVAVAAAFAYGLTTMADARDGVSRGGARDLFTGTITGATGALRSDRGSVGILILDTDRSAPSRPVTLTITPRRCPSPSACIALRGRLTGTIALVTPLIPDIGIRFRIQAAGRIGPLGHVSAAGTVQGTGFMAHGREGLRLILTAPGGAVTIDAASGLVPGFTTP